MKKLLAGFLLSLSLLFVAPVTAQFNGCPAGFCSPDDGTQGLPVSNACTNSSGTTITFTAQGIGNAQPNRISVVTINWDDSTVANTAELNAVTIGGISMARIVRAAGDNQSSNAEIWAVANPTGTSANIVLTFSTTVDAVTIEVYSLIGYDTVTGFTTGTTSVTQAYDNKQLAIATASRRTNVSTSLSNMTNDFSSACGANLWGVHASKRLTGNNQSLTSTISPTSSTPLIALAKWSVGGTPVCTSSVAFLARTSGLNTLHQNAYSNLLCGLAADGVLPKLDTLYTWATQDQTTANLNLISSNFAIAPQASPTWVADRGYSGTEGASGKYLFNGLDYAGGTNFSVASAHISIWSNSAGQTVGWDFGTVGGFGGDGIVLIVTRDTSDIATWYMNTTTGLTVSNPNGLGFYSANVGSGTLSAYKNGVSLATSTPTVNSPWGGPIPFLARNAAFGNINTGTGNQLSGASEGSSLTPTEQASLYSRMRTYMTAVGVPTVPVLTSPNGLANGSTTGVVNVTTDQSGGTIYTIVSTNSSTPTATQILNGKTASGSNATFATSATATYGSNSFNVTGLSAATTYYAFFVHYDTFGNPSAVTSVATIPPDTSQATTFLARTSGLNTTHTNAYHQLINGLVFDSLWTKFDVLHIYATQDTTTAQLNLVSASFPATLNGSPTFTADRGYTGVDSSTTVYINTGFNPTTASSPQYTQNSAHLSAWSVTNVGLSGASGGAMIGAQNAGTIQSNIFPRYNDGGAYFRTNGGATASPLNPNTLAAGHYIATRPSSSLVNGYKNGVSVQSTSDTSTGQFNGNIYVLGYNNNGTFGIGFGGQVAMASIGSSLSSTDASNFNGRLRTYMNAVGVP